MTLAANLHCSPFEIFDQDCDEVIMMINFYLILGKENGESRKPSIKQKSRNFGSNERIRVNDKTATGGWF